MFSLFHQRKLETSAAGGWRAGFSLLRCLGKLARVLDQAKAHSCKLSRVMWRRAPASEVSSRWTTDRLRRIGCAAHSLALAATLSKTPLRLHKWAKACNPTSRSILPIFRISPLFLLPSLLFFLTPVHAQSLSNAVFQKHKTKVESAVDRGLQHLANAQKSNGTFDDTYGQSVGVVSLAGMAFLSAGHTPGYGDFADNIDSCIDYILSSQRSNGILDHGDSGHGLMYAHNIATLFLSEISGMVAPEKQKKLEQVLSRATKLILAAQAQPKNDGNAGGWRYKPDSKDSDLSCSGWALMALRSGKLNGAAIPDQSIDKAVNYVLRNHHKESGRFGYQDPWGNSESLTGCGLLCLELSGFHGTKSTFRAGDFILQHRNSIIDRAHEYYANYYNAQAMFQLGGTYWEQYADWMYEQYLPKQHADGSWSNGRVGGSYGTSMMVLSFTVPYRQLPIYQRDETVDEE